MDLERERGITIKMQPVRMMHKMGDKTYQLNLIDTPGHIDFSYEVSRALRAVEGSVLLVDATQGIQAQTLTTLEMAEEAGLRIIPAISKIDSPLARVDEVRKEITELLHIDENEILLVSGKTGEGVEGLLEAIIERIPPPRLADEKFSGLRALVFDFKYSDHRGVIVFVRVSSGEVKKGDKIKFKATGKGFQSLEVGTFTPEEKAVTSLRAGEIGYIVTGIKEPGVASVGDTVTSISDDAPALLGYEKARPVVWASIYPENQDDFVPLRQALSKLRLSDSAFSFEEESSGVLGRGFRVGFLGMLHLEIITERLRREFSLPLVITLPSITYKVTFKTAGKAKSEEKEKIIYTPSFFPEDYLIDSVREPWVNVIVIVPPDYTNAVVKLLYEFEAELGEIESMGLARTSLKFSMPLRELMRGFFDKLKSVTSGFGSISYSLSGERDANVSRLDILIADEIVPAFAKVISRRLIETEAEDMVERLTHILPRQMFTTKIQAKALGRIIASRTLSGMKKNVTQHMYGGDITRKMKLREKQKKGKKKMKELGKVNIPQDVFLKMIRRD
jgi:GTP-binding protein LepA